MSVYNDVAARIGDWGKAELPPVQVIEGLVSRSMSGDAAALESLLRIKRFAPPPRNMSQIVAAHVLQRDFRAVEAKFRGMQPGRLA